jgi:mRNA interferase RelE/StbE
MYQIEFSPTAENQFNKLDLIMQGRIINVLERIKVRPYNYIKRLIGNKYFRARVGKYRLILDIQKDKLIIYVIEVGHRKNVYEK